MSTLRRRSPVSDRYARGGPGHAPGRVHPAENVTIVLSQGGWVRSAKGHDIDPTSLSYKAGDKFKACAYGRSNQPVMFMDSAGRSYAVPAHTLPSARGLGEPLTGRFNPAPGEAFQPVLMGSDDQKYLVASDAGYGFLVALRELYSKNRSGKVVLTLPPGARPMPPLVVDDVEADRVVALSNAGRLLIFPLKDLPELARGKGNNIIQIPKAKAQAREEFLSYLYILPAGRDLVVYAGKRHLTLKGASLEAFVGVRGRRGRKLPRGFRNVDRMEASALPEAEVPDSDGNSQ